MRGAIACAAFVADADSRFLRRVPLELLHVHRIRIETDDAAQRLSEEQAAAAAQTAVELVEQRKAFALAAAARSEEARTVPL